MQHSTKTLEQLEHAFDNVKRKLFSELHDIVRQQVFPADASQPPPLQLPAASMSSDTSTPGAAPAMDPAQSNGVARGEATAQEAGAPR